MKMKSDEWEPASLISTPPIHRTHTHSHTLIHSFTWSFIHPHAQEGIITPLFLLQRIHPSISCSGAHHQYFNSSSAFQELSHMNLGDFNWIIELFSNYIPGGTGWSVLVSSVFLSVNNYHWFIRLCHLCSQRLFLELLPSISGTYFCNHANLFTKVYMF